MTKRCLLLLAFALPFASSLARAQALPAVTRGGTLQAGVAISNANTDFYDKRITGITGYVTFDLTKNIGVEADVHVLTLITPNDFSESSYEFGVRYVYPVHRRYQPYVKLAAGIGSYAFNQPYYNNTASDSLGMYAFSGGLDIRLPHKINVRAVDFEYQSWPGIEPHGLTPTLLTFGVAYRIR